MDTYATCHMHVLSTLELRGVPEHARAIFPINGTVAQRSCDVQD